MRAKRKGLNPFKITVVYILAFVLVLFHQADKAALWLDDQGEYGEVAAAFVRSDIVPRGPKQMADFENRLLALWPDVTVGDKPQSLMTAKSPAPIHAEKPVAVSRAVDPKDEPLPFKLDQPPLPDGQTAAGQNPPAEPAPVTAAEEAPAAPAPNFQKVLLLGDSMMLEGLGPPLQRLLKDLPDLSVSRDGRYGTGLCRLDVFDWLKYFDEMLDKYSPDLVVITLGANDPQDIVEPGKKRVFLGSEEWEALYGQRVADLLKRAAAKKAFVLWVGLPIMGRETYGQRVAAINGLVEKTCRESSNCRFWDAWLSVADKDGNYTVFAKDANGKHVRIRAKDSIHLTEDGGAIMAEKLWAAMKGWATYGLPETVSAENQGQVMPPAAGEPEKDARAILEEVSFDSAARGKAVPFYVVRPQNVSGKVPAVFLLHGAWDNYKSWVEHGRKEILALAEKYGLVVIMPDGEPFGWYLNGRQSPIEAYMVDELIPYVIQSYPVDAKRLGIMGLSMGGHGAFTLTLKHKGLFKAAGAMSGVMDITRHAGDGKVDRSLELREALGPYDENQNLWRDNSAYWLTVNHPEALAGTALTLSVGQEDKLVVKENQLYHQLLLDLGLPHQYEEVSGGHDWKFWLSRLPKQMEFLAGHLGLAP